MVDTLREYFAEKDINLHKHVRVNYTKDEQGLMVYHSDNNIFYTFVGYVTLDVLTQRGNDWKEKMNESRRR
jgi:hypothetical protein